MYKLSDIKLNPEVTIRKALEVIDKGAMRIALVVDNKDKLLGTITDGDIRRGLLSGLGLDDSIKPIFNPNPVVCNQGDPKDKIILTAVTKKLFQIPIINELGQVIKLAEIDHLIKQEVYSNKVVLMAGGLGKRLLPLTEKLPKPMLEVGGKPILETVINRFIKHGFRNFIISLNYKGEYIMDYFEDGSKFGISIEYIKEKKKLGTAGALSLIKEKPKESFFVMNGDILTRLNFENLLEFHYRNKSYATMCVREYDMEVPYGVVKMKKSNIVSIDEKPVQKFYVNAGIYILNPEILEIVPNEKYTEMTELIENLVRENKETKSFPIREYWKDIGNEEDLRKANDEFLEIFND